LAGKYDAKVIRVENRPIWNKPHCLNVAIRQAETKYTMPIDADIILSENYLEKTIQTLKSHPLSIVLSEMLDLPEESTKILENYAKTDLKISDVELLKNKTTVRKTHTQLPEHNNIHISLHATYTFIYHEIRGYDEYYTLWGSEDNDMYRRLTYVGLTPISIGNEAYYMHQWHKKHESINSSNLGQVIKNNHIYYENNHSIARNENSWGANHD
jgi:predicted glycosyltransferase involved in capsule biosynthesis